MSDTLPDEAGLSVAVLVDSYLDNLERRGIVRVESERIESGNLDTPPVSVALGDLGHFGKESFERSRMMRENLQEYGVTPMTDVERRAFTRRKLRPRGRDMSWG